MASLDQSKPPPPPGATAEAEAAALNSQILEAGSKDHSHVVELSDAQKDGLPVAKKPANAGLANYFVSSHSSTSCLERSPNSYSQRVFTYGTKFDFFLVTVCVITSVASGLPMPLMNIVFGMVKTSMTTQCVLM
jgi:ATP-binding cassette subfamily B (MDR/TAP) protein 1